MFYSILSFVVDEHGALFGLLTFVLAHLHQRFNDMVKGIHLVIPYNQGVTGTVKYFGFKLFLENGIG
jgi:hypothetical protein